MHSETLWDGRTSGTTDGKIGSTQRQRQASTTYHKNTSKFTLQKRNKNQNFEEENNLQNQQQHHKSYFDKDRHARFQSTILVMGNGHTRKRKKKGRKKIKKRNQMIKSEANDCKLRTTSPFGIIREVTWFCRRYGDSVTFVPYSLILYLASCSSVHWLQILEKWWNFSDLDTP